MKEKEIINTIKTTLKSKHIGDDCAFLKDLNIVVTQDSLVEDVHFSLKFTDAYKLGYKSAAVNISDICASGAKPLYLTAALSLPETVDTDFIKEFYNGMKAACKDIEIVGGDITGADKLYISITAIGSCKNRRISSRKNAKAGQKIIVSGNHGSSGAGLMQLFNGDKSGAFVKAHLMPEAKTEFSRQIAENIKEDYAMTDTSDGLMDALSSIAYESGVCMSVDFSKIPHDKAIENIENWHDLIFFGGEDYELVATVPDEYIRGFVIGEVKQGYGVVVDYGDKKILYTKEDIEKKVFSHFKEK